MTERYPTGAQGLRRRCSYLCCRRCPVIALGWVYRACASGAHPRDTEALAEALPGDAEAFRSTGNAGPLWAGRRSEPHSSAAIAGWKVPVESGGPSNRGILKGGPPVDAVRPWGRVHWGGRPP